MISRRRFNQVRVLLGALLVLGATVFILKSAFPAPMKMSDDDLFKLVNGSTFTFIGTIKDLGSNVSGIEAKNSLIVQVESVEPSDQSALKKLGLEGSRLTVAVNPILGIERQKNISAVFLLIRWDTRKISASPQLRCRSLIAKKIFLDDFTLRRIENLRCRFARKFATPS